MIQLSDLERRALRAQASKRTNLTKTRSWAPTLGQTAAQSGAPAHMKKPVNWSPPVTEQLQPLHTAKSNPHLSYEGLLLERLSTPLQLCLFGYRLLTGDGRHLLPLVLIVLGLAVMCG